MAGYHWRPVRIRDKSPMRGPARLSNPGRGLRAPVGFA